MNGLLKAYPQRNMTVGKVTLMAESMANIAASLGFDILTDKAMQQALASEYFTRPVSFYLGSIVYQLSERAPTQKEDKGKDYAEAFVQLEKGNRAAALASFKEFSRKMAPGNAITELMDYLETSTELAGLS